MNIYKITRTDEWGYDDYDAAIVIAESAYAAVRINPAKWVRAEWSDALGAWIDKEDGEATMFSGWPNHIRDVSVELIGTANAGAEEGEVLASYNAG